jgi:hypothetical protein
MSRYRENERKQSIMVPIQFDQQIQPGTFEHAVDYLVDNEIDLSEFEAVYQNDETGAPGIHPGTLLKIVLFAYSRGIIGSRRMGTVEPVFGDICDSLHLDRFTLRGESKVEAQWNLFCRRVLAPVLAPYIDIGKIARYGGWQ